MSYQLSFRMIKRFEHPGGRMIEVFEDDNGPYQVRAVHPDREGFKRWTPTSLAEAVDTVAWLMGDDPSWVDQPLRKLWF